MRLKSVVLPAPLGPMSVKTSPLATSKLTSRTARTPPKLTLRFRTCKRLSEAVISPDPFGALKGFLTAEHAAPVEWEEGEERPQFQPASVDSQRFEDDEQDDHQTIDDGLQPCCLRHFRRQPVFRK